MSGTTGTYNFNPDASSIVWEAYERIGKVGIELTQEAQLLSSARRSMNFVLSSWSNRGVNLWTVEQVSQFMPQGVSQYFDDASCVDILADSVTLRQYLMGAPSSVAPAFTTTTSSTTVTIAGFTATPLAGGYINVSVPVSVGGIVLQGFYQVVSVPASGSATVTAASAATSAVAAGGTVPQFVSTLGSTTITVNFPNHGLLSGQTFNVQVATSVGGTALLGPYTVNSTGVTTNSFTITAAYAAGSAASVYENAGDTQLATQAMNAGLNEYASPTDLLLYPLSRGDFAAIPDKGQQGRPTSFWINRQTVPVFNIWLSPDANGPYELVYWRSRQVQDADITMGLQLQIPYRFLEAFTADLAAHLAMKWAADRAQALATYAQSQWVLASEEDREKVSTFYAPDMSAYYDA